MSETIGVDIGGTKLLAGVVDDQGRVLARERRIVKGLDVTALREILRDAVQALGVRAPVGVGVPAMVDQRTQTVVRCNHLPLDGVRVAEVFGAVAVDNDATCAALAEWRFGAAQGRNHVVMLTLGTGIGGGLILDGRVYRGAMGAGAELGHMPVDYNGPPCFGSCPGRGCLEALVSGSALARDAAPVLGEGITGEEVTQLALAGDAPAVELVRAMGTRFGAGLAGLAMAFNPEIIVVGGGVMALGELLLQPAREELVVRAMAPSREVPVVAAKLGPEAGMIGAAIMARGDA